MKPARSFILFSAALAINASSALASTVAAVAPARQALIESHMPNWTAVKDRSGKMKDSFLSGIGGANVNHNSLKAQVSTAWKVCLSREQKETARQQRLAMQVPTGAAGSARMAALAKVFQLRMLYNYGTLLPQMIDTSIQSFGQSQGHQYAGAQWQVEMNDAEMQAILNQYQAASGFPASAFEGD